MICGVSVFNSSTSNESVTSLYRLSHHDCWRWTHFDFFLWEWRYSSSIALPLSFHFHFSMQTIVTSFIIILSSYFVFFSLKTRTWEPSCTYGRPGCGVYQRLSWCFSMLGFLLQACGVYDRKHTTRTLRNRMLVCYCCCMTFVAGTGFRLGTFQLLHSCTGIWLP